MRRGAALVVCLLLPWVAACVGGYSGPKVKKDSKGRTILVSEKDAQPERPTRPQQQRQPVLVTTAEPPSPFVAQLDRPSPP